MAIATRLRVTAEEYLIAERAAFERHQLVDGEIIAKGRDSQVHHRILINLSGDLWNRLKSSSFEVYAANMRVAALSTSLYTYPDIVVACGEPEFLDQQFDTLLNPIVLVEILSPSSERLDRGRKFAQYRELPSLRDYVLVAQDRIEVEHFSRDGDNWILAPLKNPEDVLRLESIGCAVRLADIYARVDFKTAEQTPDPFSRLRPEA